MFIHITLILLTAFIIVSFARYAWSKGTDNATGLKEFFCMLLAMTPIIIICMKRG